MMEWVELRKLLTCFVTNCSLTFHFSATPNFHCHEAWADPRFFDGVGLTKILTCSNTNCSLTFHFGTTPSFRLTWLDENLISYSLGGLVISLLV